MLLALMIVFLPWHRLEYSSNFSWSRGVSFALILPNKNTVLTHTGGAPNAFQ